MLLYSSSKQHYFTNKEAPWGKLWQAGAVISIFRVCVFPLFIFFIKLISFRIFVFLHCRLFAVSLCKNLKGARAKWQHQASILKSLVQSHLFWIVFLVLNQKRNT